MPNANCTDYTVYRPGCWSWPSYFRLALLLMLGACASTPDSAQPPLEPIQVLNTPKSPSTLLGFEFWATPKAEASPIEATFNFRVTAVSVEHKQVLAQLNQNKPSTQKPIDWSWFAQTLKASDTSTTSRPQQLELQTPPASGLEHLAFTWSKEGNMQFMVKVPAPVHSRKNSSALKHHPEGCKSGRHEWLVCSNSLQDSVDNGRE